MNNDPRGTNPQALEAALRAARARAESGLADQVQRAFTYHPPKGDQTARYSELRAGAKELSAYLIQRCPPSRELSLALTKLEEAVMWANAAIARNE